MIFNPVISSGGGRQWMQLSCGENSIEYEPSSNDVKDVIIVLFPPESYECFFAIVDFSDGLCKSSPDERYFVSDISIEGEVFVEIGYRNDGDSPVFAYAFENTGIPIVDL